VTDLIQKNRFRTIDGMRGVAALAVVFCHLHGNLQSEFSALLPGFINSAFQHGYLGVPVFFVISGFVISLSVGNRQITKKYAGNFILRRSVRLDPTYWTCIAIALGLIFVKAVFLKEPMATYSITNVLAHMFYLQDVLTVEPKISSVYWTLCLEVQLYLFYLFSQWFSQKLALITKQNTYVLHILLMVFVGIFSLLLDFKYTNLGVAGLFVQYWHYFLLGVLVSNVVRKLPYSVHILMAWLCFETAALSIFFIRDYAITGIVATVFIYVLWSKDKLDSVLTHKSFQYFGAISYTLYLIHPDIGWKVISLGKSIFDHNASPMLGITLFFSGVVISVICAHILHLLIEKPSLAFSSKLKTLSLRETFSFYLQKSKSIQS